MATSVKITALNGIGPNIGPNTLLPVVNMAGGPNTESATVQNLGNVILSGAGGPFFTPAQVAIYSQSVVNAAQPNITSVGTLGNLVVSGNINVGDTVTANYFAGDGGRLSNISEAGSISRGNSAITFVGPTNNVLVQINGTDSLRATNEGLRVFGNIMMFSAPDQNKAIISSNNNVTIRADSSNLNIDWTFTRGGALIFPASYGATHAIESNIAGALEILSTDDISLVSGTSDANAVFNFSANAVLTTPANVIISGERLDLGPGANNLTYLHPTVNINDAKEQYVQASLTNSSNVGSADWIAYGAAGDDTGGWTDMGFAGIGFNDPLYTITAPGDGYVFVQGYTANTVGGNLVIATGENGTAKDIVFATGGFLATNEFGRISHSNNSIELTKAGAALTFPDSTRLTSAGNIVQWVSVPANSTAPGVPGEAAYDSGGNLFVCVAANTWSKITGTTSW